MSRYIASILMSTVLSFCSAAAAQEAPLRLGIVPFSSPTGLFRAHQPLIRHLESHLNRSVKLYTAADHAAFLRDSLYQRFDILITPPHFGVLCLDHGYTPLMRYKAPFKFIFVVRAQSPFKNYRDLRGKRVAFPDYASFFAQAGILKLAENGMKANEDYKMLNLPSHAAAMASVAANDADAAVTTPAPFNLAHPDIRARLRILDTNDLDMGDQTLPHLMMLADGNLDAALVKRIHAAFRSFPATEAGKAFFAASGYEGYAPISPQDIKIMLPYVEMLRQQALHEPLAPARKSP
jgi:phosphonate transport system substrate-binding protein